MERAIHDVNQTMSGNVMRVNTQSIGVEVAGAVEMGKIV